MTQSIWSANNSPGGQGLFDLFSNLDAARANGTDGLGIAELGPQPADVSAADQNFFSALNEALAGLSNPANEFAASSTDLGLNNLQSDKPTPDETKQLAFSLLAGGAGAAYLPTTPLAPNFRNSANQNGASEVLYTSPLANPKLASFQQDSFNAGSAPTIAPSTLAALQTQRSPLKLFEANAPKSLSADDLQAFVQTDASRQQLPQANVNAMQPPANLPTTNLQQLRSELSRIAPEAKVEMLAVSGENKAASQADFKEAMPLSQSLGELRESLKDHQFVFNKHLAELENKMSARLDASLAQQLESNLAAADKTAWLARNDLANSSVLAADTNKLSPLAQLTTANAILTDSANAGQISDTAKTNNALAANAVPTAALSQAIQHSAKNQNTNEDKNGEQNKFEQLFEGGYAANADNTELDAKEKKENGQDRNDGKRSSDSLTTLLDHKGPGKIWTTDAKDKFADVTSVSPLTRGALERTRNMAIQLQGRGGTAKIQISDNRVGNVNLEIRVEQGNKVFVEIRSGNQKLKEELRENVEALKRSLEDNRMALAELKFTVDSAAVAQSGASSSSQQNSQQNSGSRHDAQNLQQQLQERAAQQEGFSRQFFGGQNSGQFQSGENFAGDVVNTAARNKSFNQSAAANLDRRETNIQRSANGSLKVRA